MKVQVIARKSMSMRYTDVSLWWRIVSNDVGFFYLEFDSSQLCNLLTTQFNALPNISSIVQITKIWKWLTKEKGKSSSKYQHAHESTNTPQQNKGKSNHRDYKDGVTRALLFLLQNGSAKNTWEDRNRCAEFL